MPSKYYFRKEHNPPEYHAMPDDSQEILRSLLDGGVVEVGKAGLRILEGPVMQRMYSSVEMNRKGVEREIPFWESE